MGSGVRDPARVEACGGATRRATGLGLGLRLSWLRRGTPTSLCRYNPLIFHTCPPQPRSTTPSTRPSPPNPPGHVARWAPSAAPAPASWGTGVVAGPSRVARTASADLFVGLRRPVTRGTAAHYTALPRQERRLTMHARVPVSSFTGFSHFLLQQDLEVLLVICGAISIFNQSSPHSEPQKPRGFRSTLGPNSFSQTLPNSPTTLYSGEKYI